MVNPSKRQRLLEAIRAQLQAIDGAGTFETRAGENIELGFLPDFGEDDADIGIAIIPVDDAQGFQGEHVVIGLPIEIHALAKASLAAPWIAAEQVLGDIKRAVEISDRTYGRLAKGHVKRGTTRTAGREPGSATVGIVITYIANMTESWGAPEL